MDSWYPEVFNTTEIKDRGNLSITTFKEKFETDPQVFIRVPGRVNLIGEHIDYCGYGVFPMAIQQDIFLSLRMFPSAFDVQILKLVNTAAQHKDFECRFDEIRKILDAREIGVSPPWYFYFLCGVQGILDHFSTIQGHGVASMEVCLDGTIPPSAGLSSSSAVVCAAALAMLVANNIEMDRAELASLCAKSERYIGTEGGGMDQAIEMLAKRGTAQIIEFVPSLHGERVELPSKAIFVIANSLAESNKAASATFNTRVAECRLATWILGKHSGLEDCFKFNRFKELQIFLRFSYDEMKILIHKELHPDIYTAQEISKILELDVDSLSQKPLMNRIPFHSMEFQLYNRAKHVIEEAERVQKFRTACLDGDLEQMGILMSESHWSLSNMYDCSHPYLDKLVKLSEGTSYGARLTGAGWGGCMVALLDEAKLEGYLECLKTEFYLAEHGKNNLDDRDVFVTQPGPGASVYHAEKIL